MHKYFTASVKRKLLNVLAVAAAAVLLLPFVLDLIRAVRPDTGSAQQSESRRVILKDPAELLSASERSKLEQEMKDAGIPCDLAFISIPASADRSAGTEPAAVYDRVFQGRNGILFLIDMSRRQITVQKARSNTVLTTDKCSSIVDNVYRYASAGEYYRCASKAFRQIRSVMGGRAIPEPMQHLSNALIALGTALFLLFIPAGKTGVKTPNQVYSLDDSFRSQVQIKKMKKELIRVIEPSDSSSDSGDSRGGSSGGGSYSSSSGSSGSSGSSSSGSSHGF